MLRKPENQVIVDTIKAGMDADVLRMLQEDRNLDQHICFAYHYDRHLRSGNRAKNAIRLAHADAEYSVTGRDSNSYKTHNNRWVQLVLRWLRNDDVARLLSERARNLDFFIGIRDSTDPNTKLSARLEAAKQIKEMTKDVLHLADAKEEKLQRAMSKVNSQQVREMTREELLEALKEIQGKMDELDRTSEIHKA